MASKQIFKSKYLKAFTLIELLVVVGIIATLSAVIMVGYTQSKQKSRNSRRASDISSVTNALQLYYDDKNSVPVNVNGGAGCTLGETYTGQVCLGELVSNNYMAALPEDPSSSREYWYFHYSSSGYVTVAAQLEPRDYGPFPNGWHCSALTGGTNGLGGCWGGMTCGDPDYKQYCGGFIKKY